MNDTIQLLAKLVSIKSVYPNEGNIGKFLVQYLKKIGCKVNTQKIAENRFNIFATKNKSEKAVLFYGHLDTVDTVNTNLWNSDPFVLTKKNDKYFGLGAYDMKGGIVSFLNAIKDTKSYVKCFFAVDEENISRGAWEAISRNKQFFFDVELIISAEPNFGMGLNSVTTGRTGRCVFDVHLKGKPAHIAQFQKAKDAMEMMSVFIQKLYKKRNQIYADSGTVLQVRKVTGESVGMSVCGNVYLEIEVLLSHKDTVISMLQFLKTLDKAAEVNLKTRVTPYLTGYKFDHFPYKTDIAKIIKTHTKNNMKLVQRISVGDDNVLATLGIPVITWGPDGGNAHTANEYVEFNSIDTLTKMYRELLNKIV